MTQAGNSSILAGRNRKRNVEEGIQKCSLDISIFFLRDEILRGEVICQGHSSSQMRGDFLLLLFLNFFFCWLGNLQMDSLVAFVLIFWSAGGALTFIDFLCCLTPEVPTNMESRQMDILVRLLHFVAHLFYMNKLKSCQ